MDPSFDCGAIDFGDCWDPVLLSPDETSTSALDMQNAVFDDLFDHQDCL
jgi:hypothetical protein